MRVAYGCSVKGTTVTVTVNGKPESFNAEYLDEREIREHIKYVGITYGYRVPDEVQKEYLIQVLRDLGRTLP